jgi:hypothetical protein
MIDKKRFFVVEVLCLRGMVRLLADVPERERGVEGRFSLRGYIREICTR